MVKKKREKMWDSEGGRNVLGSREGVRFESVLWREDVSIGASVCDREEVREKTDFVLQNALQINTQQRLRLCGVMWRISAHACISWSFCSAYSSTNGGSSAQIFAVSYSSLLMACVV